MDGELGGHPTESDLEACDNQKANGSQSVAPRPAAPSLPGNLTDTLKHKHIPSKNR